MTIKNSHKNLDMDDLDLKYLRRIVYKMFKNKELEQEGIRSNMVYFTTK